MLKSFVFIFAFLFLTTACQTKMEFIGKDAPTASSEAGGKGLVGTARWIKNKGKSVDIQMELGNEYGFPIEWRSSGVTLEFQGKKFGVRGDGSGALGVQVYTDKVFIMAFKEELEHIAGKVILTIEPEKSDGKKLSPLKVEIPLPVDGKKVARKQVYKD